jgi:acetyl esterase/lipase
MLATTAAGAAPPSSSPRALFRLLRLSLALGASVLAVFCTAVLLGAYVPGLPKIGLLGPVLAGQYPLHVVLIAGVGLLLALLARRSGLVRWGRVLTAVTAACVAAALVILSVQVGSAARAGTDISWSSPITEPGYPAVSPDQTVTYARPGGAALDVDVYLPPAEARGGTPAIVLAHAGGFRTFDKSDLRGTGRWLAEHGVAAFAVDYRLATASTPTWDEAPQDLVCALAWVQDDAARFGVDPARVSLGGMSAGGTLAMSAAYRLVDGTIGSSCGRNPAPPASVVGFYPASDLVQNWEDDVLGTREAAEWFTGGTPQQQPERYAEVSPISHVRPGLPPTLLVTGGRDPSPARPAAVAAFGRALVDSGNRAVVRVLPFAPHAFDDAYGSLTSQASRAILLDFLRHSS